ncbi:MAG TPA: HAMP domain-containing sensor histidine kinase, partial [Polyangiaceae bacterium]|nr:HAMP domain-containing sensor histidine kinase [Polyangiaceae bacterium]
SSGRRMAGLLEDLIDLARARLAEGIPLDRSDVDLAPLAEKVVAEQRSLCPDCRFELTSGGDLRGHWDGGRLEQVLSNLLGNASHHRRPGSPVSLTLRGDDPGRVELSVHNAGSIAPELLPELFNPFRSGGGARGRSAGLGLGLYIVDQIVRGHGGRVNVRSDGEGVTFCVDLPRRA